MERKRKWKRKTEMKNKRKRNKEIRRKMKRGKIEKKRKNKMKFIHSDIKSIIFGSKSTTLMRNLQHNIKLK